MSEEEYLDQKYNGHMDQYLSRLDLMERDGVPDEASGPFSLAVGIVSLGVVLFGIVQIAGMFA